MVQLLRARHAYIASSLTKVERIPVTENPGSLGVILSRGLAWNFDALLNRDWEQDDLLYFTGDTAGSLE